MRDDADGAEHLTDDEIDAYWKRELGDADEQRIEQHYLDCDTCRARVSAVEDLIDGLRAGAVARASGTRGVTFWRIAAAILLMVSAVAGWQWMRSAAAAREAAARLERQQNVSVARVDAQSSGLPIVVARLAPPTRDEQVPAIVPAVGSVIVFELDAREAGSGGTRFDVSMSTATGRTVVRLTAVESTSDGVVRVPVDGALLAPGQYVFELTAGPTVAGFPFLIRR